MASMFSNKANYDMDEAQNELNIKHMLLDVKVETQTILQLLVQKEIVTREEVAQMRSTVRNSPQYKQMYDYLKNAEASIKYYQDNPEEHLKAVFNAKMNGTIK